MKTWHRHLAGLSSRDDGKRYGSVVALIDAWNRGDAETRTTVAKALREEALKVAGKRGAGVKLSWTLRLQHPLTMEVLAIMACASTSDSMVRDTAQMAMGSEVAVSDDMLDFLVASLNSADPLLRGGAVLGLSQGAADGADIDRATDLMAVLATDQALPKAASWQVGFAVTAHAVAHPGDPRGTARVLEILSGENPHPIRGSVSRLARQPTALAHAVQVPLARLVRHKSKTVRDDAGTALGFAYLLSGDAEGIASMLAKKRTRGRAAIAMRIAAPQLPASLWAEVLLELTEDPDGFIRWTALHGLLGLVDAEQAIDDDRIALIAEEDPEERCRSTAAQILS